MDGKLTYGELEEEVKILEAAVNEHTRIEKQLKESKEKYDNLLENLREGYFEVDLRGNYTVFNSVTASYHKRPSEEIRGMNYREYMTPELAKRTFKVFNQVYQTGRPGRMFDFVIIAKDILYRGCMGFLQKPFNVEALSKKIRQILDK